MDIFCKILKPFFLFLCFLSSLLTCNSLHGKYKIFVSLDNGRLLTVNSTTGVQEKITKIHGSKISRPYVLNNSMYFIKDNAIAKTN